MALALSELQDRLTEAATPNAVASVLRDVEELTVSEVEDWLMLMRFVPVEPPG